MKKGSKVKVIDGNNELGQPTMIGKTGIVESIGTNYIVNGVETCEVYVKFKHYGLHVFNDYHLKQLNDKTI